MTLHFENETPEEFPFDPEKIAKLVIHQACSEIGCPYEVEVDLCMTDGPTIRKLNKEYRDVDSVTDVLSFPLVSYEEPARFPEEILIEQDAFNPDTGELMLGDIVICTSRMKQQAQEYGHGEKREFAFLTAHSMLHLFGFDHMTEDEAKEMEALQDKILDALGITR